MSSSCLTLNAAPPPGWKEIEANHAQLEQRNAVHRRFGYDSASGVRFALEKALPLRGQVLDIGTGRGRFVIALARHVAHVTTVDVSAEEQRCARLEAVYSGVSDRIRFVLQDARLLPWSAGSFDVVVSWNVFHHLDDPAQQDRHWGGEFQAIQTRGRENRPVYCAGPACHNHQRDPMAWRWGHRPIPDLRFGP